MYVGSESIKFINNDRVIRPPDEVTNQMNQDRIKSRG